MNTTTPRSEATISKTENVRATTLARAAAREEADHEFLKVPEVAARLRVAPMTIYRLIHARELPAVQVGRSYRIRAGVVDAYLREREVGQ
jgi:excisionase family DNA binding protein